MFCPNCGKENSTEQKFCRACGIGLEKTVESLMEQKHSSAQNDSLLRKRILLETFGTIATGGLITVTVIGVSAIVYTILTKMILTGSSVLFGSLLTAFIVFSLLTLIYVVFRESLNEKQNKRKTSDNELSESKNTSNLLEDKPFEPAASVTETSTELLYTKKQNSKTSMSLIDVQNFLARVYTDENLRRKFLSALNEIGKANNLSEREISELAEVLPEELNSFADSLFYKRLREVEKFLPLTKSVLGQAFEKQFRIFADLYLPSSIKRHLEDAVKFCGHLQKDKSTSIIEKNTAKFEQAKLEFYGFEKPLIIKIFDCDIKTNQKRKHFTVWLRIGSRTIVF